LYKLEVLLEKLIFSKSLEELPCQREKALYLEGIKTHMASPEEAVKNENSSAQPNSASETSKSTQPVSNPVTSSASVKVNRSFPCSYVANRTTLTDLCKLIAYKHFPRSQPFTSVF